MYCRGLKLDLARKRIECAGRTQTATRRFIQAVLKQKYKNSLKVGHSELIIMPHLTAEKQLQADQFKRVNVKSLQ